jgi:hypothetical protein
MDVKKLLSICKGIDRFNAQDLMQDTFIRLNNRYPINEDYYKIFYTTAKNIFLDSKRKKTPHTTTIDLIDIQDTESYNPSIYKKALDNFLIKNNSTIFADVIELYLICPNITKMSKQTNISRIKLHKIIETSKNEIGLEYIRIASNINSDNDTTI